MHSSKKPMTLIDYREQVNWLPCGKRLPKAVYVYREALVGLGGDLGALVDQVVARYHVSEEFNLVKFRTDELKLSFLAYPDFRTDPHPALRHAITVDLATGKARHTDYAGNPNPPILHRKESFLPAGHPWQADFEALTRAEEVAGVYENPNTIGFKLNWEKLLDAKGLVLEGHCLAEKRGGEAEKWMQGKRDSEGEPAPLIVERHRTALTRYELSKPVKSLLEYGVLRSGMGFFV